MLLILLSHDDKKLQYNAVVCPSNGTNDMRDVTVVGSAMPDG